MLRPNIPLASPTNTTAGIASSKNNPIVTAAPIMKNTISASTSQVAAIATALMTQARQPVITVVFPFRVITITMQHS